jgi:hypothetical protein
MPPITHVFVTVPTGRLVPVPANEGTGAGGRLLMCEPGKVYCQPWSTYTRKRIAGGDFALATRDGSPARTREEASASASTLRDDSGAVAADQRTDATINAEAAKAAKAALLTKGKE